MSSHRIHSILTAPFEVAEIARFRGFTTLELDGSAGGMFREHGDGFSASILMDIIDPVAQAKLELLAPGQKLKVYFELEHPHDEAAAVAVPETPPVIIGYVHGSATGWQTSPAYT